MKNLFELSLFTFFVNSYPVVSNLNTSLINDNSIREQFFSIFHEGSSRTFSLQITPSITRFE